MNHAEDNEQTDIVAVLFIVKDCQNLTANDTFNEETFTGSTQATNRVNSFFTEEEAFAFYKHRKASLKFAGCAGDYVTYPTKWVAPKESKRNILLELYREPTNWKEEGAQAVYYSIWCPAKKEICSRCDGEGLHTNPNIDGNGLSEEDCSDPDFMESYMRGDYDVRCEACKGEKVIKVPDLEIMPDDIKEDYEHMISERARSRAEDRAARERGG